MVNGLPRFNMPLELGLFLGAKEFGAKKQRQKCCLVLDSELYRYQKFISDISGQDISVHNGKFDSAIGRVRDWLSNSMVDVMMPTETAIVERYKEFRASLPLYCATFKMRERTSYRDVVKAPMKTGKE